MHTIQFITDKEKIFIRSESFGVRLCFCPPSPFRCNTVKAERRNNLTTFCSFRPPSSKATARHSIFSPCLCCGENWWCTQRESNAQSLPSEGNALSSYAMGAYSLPLCIIIHFVLFFNNLCLATKYRPVIILLMNSRILNNFNWLSKFNNFPLLYISGQYFCSVFGVSPKYFPD